VETKTVEALVSVGGRYVGQAPLFTVESPWWSEIGSVTRQLDELLGTPTMVLRLLETHDADRMRGGRVLYHVQVESEPRPGVLDPRPRPDWPDLTKPHPLRSTWAEVDGPRRLISWATGFIGEDTPAQVKSWNLSCLIQFAGAGAWAKATSRFCSVDADIIQHVHRYDAALAPGVLAVDLDNRWSLLRHAPGIDCWEPDQATVQDVVSRWVAVQAALAAEADELNTPRMLPRDLPGELDSLLAGEAGTQLSAEELAGARQLTEDLPAIIDALESSGLPNTLVHGDFHPGNWRSDGTNRLIVDWADSYVGHPAADIERLRVWLPVEKQDNAVSTWTAAWRKHLPGSEPSRALKPSTVIAELLGAVTYQRFLDNIEPSERIYHQGDPADCIRDAVIAAAALDQVR